MGDADAVFGVRQLAAAFPTGVTKLKAIKSGSKLPHSKANLAQNNILRFTRDRPPKRNRKELCLDGLGSVASSGGASFWPFWEFQPDFTVAWTARFRNNAVAVSAWPWRGDQTSAKRFLTSLLGRPADAGILLTIASQRRNP